MNITIADITDLEFDGIKTYDAPDFSDAYIASAWNTKENRPCTDEELDYIQDKFSVDVDELLREYLY